MNFLEARKAALEGKKVKSSLMPDVIYTELNFSKYLAWCDSAFDAEWEIVEEPKLITYYHHVYEFDDSVKPGNNYWRILDMKVSELRLSTIAITVDSNGKFIKGENV